VGTEKFVREGRYKRLREMWCAGRFGAGYANRLDADCLIEIETEDEQRDYDFHLHTMGACLPFQIAEVLEHDRRRGDEYKNLDKKGMAALVASRPIKSRAYACEHVASQLAKKAKRLVPCGSLNMLLYLNLNVPDLPCEAVSSAAEPYATTFASIWIFSEYFVACLAGGSRWAGARGWGSIDLMA
jgi:hypothetical protein